MTEKKRGEQGWWLYSAIATADLSKEVTQLSCWHATHVERVLDWENCLLRGKINYMYRLFTSIVLYERKTNFGLRVLSVVRVCLFCTRDVKVRWDYLPCYSLSIGDFISNPRNVSVTVGLSPSPSDKCDVAIGIRSLVLTCVEWVSKIFISKYVCYYVCYFQIWQRQRRTTASAACCGYI